MTASKRDFYEVLGLSKSATDEQIKKAYRKLAVKFHPDKNPGDKASEERFKELGEAYDVLSDPQKKAAYDQYGHAAFDPRNRGGGGFGGTDPMDIFREVFGRGEGGSIFDTFFGGGENRRSSNGAQRGDDLRYDLEITLEESVHGVEKEIKVTREMGCSHCHGSGAEAGAKKTTCVQCAGRGRVVMSRGIFSIQQTCPRCHGEGSIIDNPCGVCGGSGHRSQSSAVTLKIPAGVDTGMRLRSAGNGDAGVRGGPSGDLFVFIHVREHEIFQREGNDLLCEVPIAFTQAALGSEINVPTLSGKAQIRLPAGTQHGTVFRLKGKGVKDIQGHGQGDLRVKVIVEVPTKLTGAQRQKLEEFAHECDESVNPQSRSFFERARSFFG